MSNVIGNNSQSGKEGLDVKFPVVPRTMIPIACFYALIFMNNGAFNSYVSLYYASIDLTNAQIGVLTSMSALVALFAQPLWGTISDRAATKNHILTLLVLGSAISIWLTPLAGSALGLLLVFTSVYYLFHCAVNPLSDAVTLELASREGFSFSIIRTVGSLGFALTAAVAGRVIESNIMNIFVAVSVLMFSAFLLSFRIPPVQGHQDRTHPVRFWELFRSPQLCVIYTYTFLLSCTLGFFFSFHAIFSVEQGVSTSVLGTAIMIGSFSQFPFMVLFDRINRRFRVVDLLTLSGLIFTVRWFLYAGILSPETILPIWLLHGGTYIVIYLCLADYVYHHVRPELQATGQMMNAVIIMGISRAVGSALGGAAANSFGLQAAFLGAAFVCLAAVVSFAAIVTATPLFRASETIPIRGKT